MSGMTVPFSFHHILDRHGGVEVVAEGLVGSVAGLRANGGGWEKTSPLGSLPPPPPSAFGATRLLEVSLAEN